MNEMETILKSIIDRVKAKLKPGSMHRTLFHSADMDKYFDMDAPPDADPPTAVRLKLKAMKVRKFVRLPLSTNLINYLEIDY